MVIKNVLVYGEDQVFTEGEVCIREGKFAEETADEEVVDGEGCFAIPGLVDIHFHGCVGVDFCDASSEAIAKMAEYEASVGVTSICPATMTLEEELLHEIMKTAGKYHVREEDCTGAEGESGKYTGNVGAKLVGINMEGPFISTKKKGAQAAEHIRPCSLSLYRKLQEESDHLIRLVDIAPETEGAMEFIEAVKGETVISIAHTTADYDTASEAFARGASHVTHLYNAMPPLNHRDPGVIGAARDARDCHVELICDGVHIHPSVVRATFEMFGAERVILISDSMRATGLTDGQYTLGGQDVFVKGAKATLADGTIAGSATNLMGCLRKVVKEMEIPLETAVACATMNPAREIGIYDTCGSITPGKDADLVLLDKDLQVKAVYVSGRKVTNC